MPKRERLKLWLRKTDKNDYQPGLDADGNPIAGIFYKFTGGTNGGDVLVNKRRRTTFIKINKRGPARNDFNIIGVRFVNSQNDVGVEEIEPDSATLIDLATIEGAVEYDIIITPADDPDIGFIATQEL